jgi:hypothetical protein
MATKKTVRLEMHEALREAREALARFEADHEWTREWSFPSEVAEQKACYLARMEAEARDLANRMHADYAIAHGLALEFRSRAR